MIDNVIIDTAGTTHNQGKENEEGGEAKIYEVGFLLCICSKAKGP